MPRIAGRCAIAVSVRFALAQPCLTARSQAAAAALVVPRLVIRRLLMCLRRWQVRGTAPRTGQAHAMAAPALCNGPGLAALTCDPLCRMRPRDY